MLFKIGWWRGLSSLKTRGQDDQLAVLVVRLPTTLREEMLYALDEASVEVRSKGVLAWCSKVGRHLVVWSTWSVMAG